ncbi:MAG: hypothetical protein PHT21_01010 [Lachnospiraceae bacterium]|nr:hypothetical protein [Lachnospiraceae bacterium]
MKKTIIKIFVCIVTFFASIAVIGAITNQGNADMTVEMSPAEFPLVYVVRNGTNINCMHGYASRMKESFIRDSVTPIGEDRKIRFHADTYDLDIKGLGFEVRSADGSRLIENTEISEYNTTKEGIDLEVTLKDLIEPDTEYTLIFLITKETGEVIRYYTRVLQSEELFTDEKLNFVNYFHESTFTKNNDIIKYLEPNSEGDNTTFNKVNIHSSFSQITWGDLSVMKAGDVHASISEIGSQTATVLLKYVAMVNEEKYQVTEYYRVKYGTERMYLLDFERTMNQYPQMNQDIFSSSKIMIGISSPSIEKRESEDGNMIAFVQQNTLYSFNMVDNKYVRLFSFYDNENWDARTLFDKHGIRILSVEETGNVRFMVYGYMNRGRHEGSVGIQVYYFNSMTNTIEEDIFIHYDRSYELLAKEINNLAYVSKDNVMYLMLDGTIYSVDLIAKDSKIIASGLTEDSYKVSENNKMIAWQSETDKTRNKELILLNLNTTQESRTSVLDMQRVAPLGFMGDDIIYGIADQDDIITDKAGETIFPMKKVIIQNEQGEILKEYQQEGVFVTEGLVEDNLLTLKRITKTALSEEQDVNLLLYERIEDDQILNAKQAESTQNSLESVVIQDYETVIQVVLKKTVTPDTIKFMTPKEVLFEGGREISLAEVENEDVKYYVYDPYGVDSDWTDPAKAVKRAFEITGVVRNESGGEVWAPGNRMTKNQIMKITETFVEEGETSLSVCLDSILAFEGIQKSSNTLLLSGMTINDILEDNIEESQALILSGCTLDSVLYYVNREIPVMAMLNDGNAVLIVGFNELNTVIMDPQTGTIYKKGILDSTQWFEENGNNFITYTKKE